MYHTTHYKSSIIFYTFKIYLVSHFTPYQLLTVHCYDISHHVKQSKYGVYQPLGIPTSIPLLQPY